MLDGLMSRCITPAECKNLSAHKIWYTMLITCSDESLWRCSTIKVVRSYSKYSYTINILKSLSFAS